LQFNIEVESRHSPHQTAINCSLRIGVPERATDGQQDASLVGAIYMAAKKTAKKSTKKTGKKKSKR